LGAQSPEVGFYEDRGRAEGKRRREKVGERSPGKDPKSLTIKNTHHHLKEGCERRDGRKPHGEERRVMTPTH